MHKDKLNEILMNDFSDYHFRPLSSQKLKDRSINTYKYIAGWSFEVVGYKCDLTITEEFPYDFPHVYLYGDEIIPHVDNKRQFCIFAHEAIYDVTNTKGMIRELLNKTEENLSLSDCEKEDEFMREFFSYVNVDENISVELFSEQKFDKVSVLSATEYQVDNKIFLSLFDEKLRDRFSNKKQPKTNINCIVFPTKKSVKPYDMPKKNKELLDFISSKQITKNVFSNINKDTIFIFSYIYNDKRVLWGAMPGSKRDETKLAKTRNTNNKFDRIKNFLSNNGSIRIFLPIRNDEEFLFSRLSNDDISSLQEKEICIIGLGSVGGMVAKQLVQSGIKKITLIDYDVLSCENLSRHILGQDSINYHLMSLTKKDIRYKSDEIEKNLRNTNIYSNIITKKGKWERFRGDVNFNKMDLILSFTGDVMSDIKLRKEISAPILYGFVMPDAIEGHAILTKSEVEMSEIYNDTSDNVVKDAIFDYKDAYQTDLTCGGSFTTYGTVQLSQINSMITEFALSYLNGEKINNNHKIWISSENHIKKCGKDPNKIKKGYVCGSINEKH